MAMAEWCGGGRSRREREWGMAELELLPSPTNFILPPPPSVHPKSFVEEHFLSKKAGKPRMNFLKGTTTLAFTYTGKTPQDKGGVLVAVDARASTGSYIASGTVRKILDVSDRMVGTMAGGAADCQFWMRVLAQECSLFELRHSEKMSLAAASKLLSNVLYNYRGMGLSVGSMVAGVDKKGPGIYYVDQDGVRLKSNMFSVGSGMIAAYGILDAEYKEVMTDEEAFNLGRKAIMHATHQDVGSGGVVNICYINADDKKYTMGVDVSDLYDDFQKKKNRQPYDPPL